MVIKKNLFILTISIILFSCTSNIFYDKNIEINNSVWNTDSTAIFNVTVEDTINYFDFYLNLRNTTDYKYSNIYFFIDTKFPDGNHTQDTVECLLSDKKGKWYGSGIGKVKSNSYLLKREIKFLQKGVYSFEIQQAMRTRNLNGIKNIGITIKKSN